MLSSSKRSFPTLQEAMADLGRRSTQSVSQGHGVRTGRGADTAASFGLAKQPTGETNGSDPPELSGNEPAGTGGAERPNAGKR